MTIENDNIIHLAAKLYYIDGLDQTEVSRLIGLSRSQISRLLARAREKNIVTINVAPYDPRNLALEEQLKSAFDLRHVYVVKALKGASTIQIRRNTGYFIGPILSELITPNMVVGVAGGRTLAEVANKMDSTTRSLGITIAGLMGNIGPSVTASDPIEIGTLLARRFGGTFYTLNSPAFVTDIQTRDLFMAHEQISRVYDLFQRMQLALIGIGTTKESAFFERGMLSLADGKKLREAGVVGEICGRFYDRNGQECKTDFQERVISISLDDLRSIPEVIAITNGSERTEAISAAIHGGLFKSLVIDEIGANALLASAAT